MERRVRGNPHARCGAGEKVEMTSKLYLLLSYTERQKATARKHVPPSIVSDHTNSRFIGIGPC